MTPRETALLQSLIKWCRDAADNAAAKNREGEVVGFLKCAARLEQELKNGE